jgi:predicted DNA-binding protein
MQVRFEPDTESRLNELASKTGRSTADLIEDAMVGYLAEVAETRTMLDGRYDEVKSGRVKLIDNYRMAISCSTVIPASLRIVLRVPTRRFR